MSCQQDCKKYWREISCSDWKKTVDLVENKLPKDEQRWIFRGVPDYCHDLTSSLDRALDAVKKGGKTICQEERWKHEANMLYQFKRRAHHYLGADHTPRPEDFLEWFSLMRHYGAPSRLVDFSYSFYIAAYFAVCTAEKDAAVYCVNYTWLNEQVKKQLVRSNEFFQNPKVFWKYAMPHPSKNSNRDPIQRKPFVVPVRPFRSNERIHVQQGLFLCPTDVNATFIENLQAMCNPQEEAAKNIRKIKIQCDWYAKKVMPDLRKMNISSESLYPGMIGFAASIRDLLYEQPLEIGRLNEAIKKNPIF